VGEERAADPELVEGGAPDVAGPLVDQAGAGDQGRLAPSTPAECMRDELRHVEPLQPRQVETLGAVGEQLREGREWGERQTGATAEVAGDVVGDGSECFVAARVEPRHDGPDHGLDGGECRVVLDDQHAGLGHAGHTDRRDPGVGRVSRQLPRDLVKDGVHRVDQGCGVHLGTAVRP
jgi:hypothetical protein